MGSNWNLVFNILDAANVNSAGVNRNQASHLQKVR